jgi:hypothetical protein
VIGPHLGARQRPGAPAVALVVGDVTCTCTEENSAEAFRAAAYSSSWARGPLKVKASTNPVGAGLWPGEVVVVAPGSASVATEAVYPLLVGAP